MLTLLIGTAGKEEGEGGGGGREERGGVTVWKHPLNLFDTALLTLFCPWYLRTTLYKNPQKYFTTPVVLSNSYCGNIGGLGSWKFWMSGYWITYSVVCIMYSHRDGVTVNFWSWLIHYQGKYTKLAEYILVFCLHCHKMVNVNTKHFTTDLSPARHWF